MQTARASVLVLALLPVAATACREPVRDELAPRAALSEARHPSRIVLVAPEEPGEPLEVSGQVFAPDGVTPASGVTVYVYQTDVSGLYARRPGDPPRLRGWMTTDAEGRYAFRTIRPAPYPSRDIQAHIHVQLWGGGWPWQYNEDVLFADDPLVHPRTHEYSRELGRFGPVHALARSSGGVLSCTHDLRLKADRDRGEDNILHGVHDEPGRGDEPERPG